MLARAQGCEGRTVTSGEDVEAALTALLAVPSAALLHIPVQNTPDDQDAAPSSPGSGDLKRQPEQHIGAMKQPRGSQ
ncbi:hypothetical protein GCM10029964_092620 [Kibdelosporangium lantanae]